MVPCRRSLHKKAFVQLRSRSLPSSTFRPSPNHFPQHHLFLLMKRTSPPKLHCPSFFPRPHSRASPSPLELLPLFYTPISTFSAHYPSPEKDPITILIWPLNFFSNEVRHLLRPRPVQEIARLFPAKAPPPNLFLPTPPAPNVQQFLQSEWTGFPYPILCSSPPHHFPQMFAPIDFKHLRSIPAFIFVAFPPPPTRCSKHPPTTLCRPKNWRLAKLTPSLPALRFFPFQKDYPTPFPLMATHHLHPYSPLLLIRHLSGLPANSPPGFFCIPSLENSFPRPSKETPTNYTRIFKDFFPSTLFENPSAIPIDRPQT